MNLFLYSTTNVIFNVFRLLHHYIVSQFSSIFHAVVWDLTKSIIYNYELLTLIRHYLKQSIIITVLQKMLSTSMVIYYNKN
jgi:hypothetical protein